MQKNKKEVSGSPAAEKYNKEQLYLAGRELFRQRVFRIKNILIHVMGGKGFILLLSVITGVVSGAGAVLLKHFTHFCHHLVDKIPCNSLLMQFLAPLIPCCAILICIFIVRYIYRLKQYDKSLACVILSTTNGTSDLPPSKMYSHILTSGLAVGFGASAGLEAPSALTGSAIGSNIAKMLRLGREGRTLLLACGGGGAISAIFDSPVAGALFACEILLPSFSVPALVPLLMASAAASVVSQLFAIPSAFIQLSEGTAWTIHNIFCYVLIGVCCGLLSAFVIKSTLFIGKKLKKFSNKYVEIFASLTMIYLTFLLFPALKGEGYSHISALIEGKSATVLSGSLLAFLAENPWWTASVIALLFLLKPVISALCIESGGDGGIFGPSLFTGAFSGYFLAKLINASSLASIDPVNCIAVGMGGVLAGVMHAPLTGIFLIAEITGGYKLFVPLMIVAALSSFISKRLTGHNIYKSAIVQRGGIPEMKEGDAALHRHTLRSLVETDYMPVKENDTLRTLLDVVIHSRHTVFPVVDEDGFLKGVVRIANIRPYLLNTEMHDVVLIYDVMGQTGPALDVNDNLKDAARLFEHLRTNHLPVLEEGKYAGFISKAGLFDAYRANIQGKHELF
ncbi:MAG: chloride channel protein [Lentisphaeria bacterium]|nr:chloride channel protein [Lentisphaeria bacterium]